MKEKRIHLAPDFSLPANDYANQANAVLGIREAGKTYTAMKAAEELLDCDIPIIVFDPVGIWKNLKIGVGKHKGYPIVVAGGEGSDIRLTKENAVDIVRAAMKENVSLVLDLYSPELINKATWIAIVHSVVDLLMYENKNYGLRHIFLEEAAEFIPQKLQHQHFRVYASLERVARMGRNAHLGMTIINQRAEEVNKAILEICELCLLHKQVGKNSLLSIQKWFDVRQLENVSAIIKSLPMLNKGECWAVGLTDQPQRIQISKKHTYHPNPKESSSSGEKLIGKLARDVSSFVTKMNEQLESSTKFKGIVKTVQDLQPGLKAAGIASNKDANLISSLRSEISLLKEQAKIKDQEIKKWRGFVRDIDTQLVKVELATADFARKIKKRLDDETNVPESETKSQKSETNVHENGTNVQENGQKLRIGDYSDLIKLPPGISLPPGERSVLIACAQFGHSLERKQLTTLTGYAKSSRDTYISRLKEKGLLEQDGSRIIASAQGISLLGDDFKRLPTGDALRRYWLQRLPPGEKTVLEVLISVHPENISRDEVSEKTEYAKSSRDTYISRMMAKELVEVTGKGFIRASSNLFD